MQNQNSYRVWIWGGVLALCVMAAYGNIINGAFIFDEIPTIVQNEGIRKLSALDRVFFDYRNVMRPLVALTFAVDYALYGNNPTGYHVLNLAVHVIATLLLFGVVRRMLLSRRGAGRREEGGEDGSVVRSLLPPPSSLLAPRLAFAIALMWGLHPLQTEAVTYIVQRSESMMGMFFLLALYCVIRGAEPGAKTSWHIGAIAAGILGAGCKQVIVVMPLVVLLYDRCFISGSFKAALKRAPRLYAGLLASWLAVGLFMLAARGSTSAGFGLKITPVGYASAQFVIIVHYLKLVFWPVNQVFDYVWRTTDQDLGAILLNAALIAALFGLTIWQLARNSAQGFWGAWFFLILAPTSSILPIGDLAAERRMYLPLAAVIVLVVTGMYCMLRKWIAASAPAVVVTLALIAAAGLGILTGRRNALYQDPLAMWQDVLSKRPDNTRALLVVGGAMLAKGKLNEAAEKIERAAKLKPPFFEALRALGDLRFAQMEYAAAADAYSQALELNHDDLNSWHGLSKALDALGHPDQALKALEQAAKLAPNDAQIQFDFGNRLFQRGNVGNAIDVLAGALKLAPDSAEIHSSLGAALATAGRLPEALSEFDAALKYNPRHTDALVNRGRVLSLMGRGFEAISSFRGALNIDPKRADAASALAWILATSPGDKLRNGAEAVTLAEKACELTQRRNPLMLDTLAAAYAEAGQFEKAVATEESALKLNPNDALAKEIRGHLEMFKAGKAVREGKK